MSEHLHEAGPVEFKITPVGEFAPYYTCTECGLGSYEAFPDKPKEAGHEQHDSYVDGCIVCKALTLQVNTGDAGRAEHMSAKKWDGELNAYREARRQGIQPAGTTMKAINEAKEASQKLGSAFNAESMGDAKTITKHKAKVMKETGIA